MSSSFQRLLTTICKAGLPFPLTVPVNFRKTGLERLFYSFTEEGGCTSAGFEKDRPWTMVISPARTRRPPWPEEASTRTTSAWDSQPLRVVGPAFSCFLLLFQSNL